VRRTASLLLVPALALGACGGGQDPTLGDPSATTVDRTAPLHPELTAFLDEAAGGADASFTAAYDVLQKLGGRQATPTVEQRPPATRISVDDLVVVTGPDAATCRTSAEACVEGVREERLAAFGIFSGFATTGPAEALIALGRRADAGEPERSIREVAGVEAECIAVPIGGEVANTTCITEEGIVVYVDSASYRIELTGLDLAGPADALDPPFPVGDDPSFLAD
jgi:hypothetical protein